MIQKMVRNERKVQILQGLHECMLEKPFHQTSIKDIAKKADVNHGLLHYYFESKEDILLKYIDFTFDKYSTISAERINRKFKETAGSIESFADVFRWTLNEVSFNPELARIYTEIWAHAIYNRKVMEKLKGHYRLWQGRMNALVKDIVSDKKTAKRLSLTVLAIAEGLSLFSIFFNRNQLCTDIDCCKLLQSLVPEDDLKFE
jgi:AcrR family transcriptional regulator